MSTDLVARALAKRAGGLQGPPGLVNRGTWSGPTSYTTDDLVSYDGEGYVALQPNNAVTPGTNTAVWFKLVSKGPAGPAGTGASGEVKPATLGVLSWTFDPIWHRGENGKAYPGQVWGSRINLPAGTVTGVNYRVWTAGTGMVSGQNFVGLISLATGQRVAITADQTTNFGAAGAKYAAFAAPATVTAGDYYVGFLCNTTGGGANAANLPALACSYKGDTDLMNFRAAGQPARFCKIGGEFDLTAFPTTFDFGGNQANNTNFLAIIV